ncbi:hypothetical protein [Salinibacterium sp. ZJ454]|nr:hypothetical protein [Salinibacterium sp. ZJ454]
MTTTAVSTPTFQSAAESLAAYVTITPHLSRDARDKLLSALRYY